jgi:hypothetical protein
MAKNVQALLSANTDYKILILAGGVHSKLTKGIMVELTSLTTEEFQKLSNAEKKEYLNRQGANEKYKPMGYFLRQALGESQVMALRIDFQSGTAWACFDTTNPCGARELGPYYRWENFSTKENFFYKQPLYEYTMGYTGVLQSKNITASPPLVNK